MTERKPRCVLSFSRRVLIIAAARALHMATAAAASASRQLPGARTRWRNRNRTLTQWGLQGSAEPLRLACGSFVGRRGPARSAGKHRRLAVCINSKYTLSCAFSRRPEMQPVAVKSKPATTCSLHVNNGKDSHSHGHFHQSDQSIQDDGGFRLRNGPANNLGETSDVTNIFTLVKLPLF